MTRQFVKRLDALAARFPASDGLFTLEELSRAIWRQDPNRFRKLATERFPELLSLIPGFEREDTLLRQERRDS